MSLSDEAVRRIEEILCEFEHISKIEDAVRVYARLKRIVDERLPEKIHGAALTGGEMFRAMLNEPGVDGAELAAVWFDSAKTKAASPNWALDAPLYRGIARQIGIEEEFEETIGRPARAWLDLPMREGSDFAPAWCTECEQDAGRQVGMLNNWSSERDSTLLLWQCPEGHRWVLSIADVCMICGGLRDQCGGCGGDKIG